MRNDVHHEVIINVEEVKPRGGMLQLYHVIFEVFRIEVICYCN